MEKVVTKSHSGQTVFVQTVYFEVTSPKTYAAAVLLNNYYLSLDETNLKSFAGRMKMISFSRRFLTNVKRETSCLVCAYCKRPELIIERKGMKVPNRKKATIDHVVPISDRVNPFDETNLVVACGKCNSKKSNMPVEEFLKIVKHYEA